MADAVRLSPADSVVIHGVCALVAGRTPWGNDAMVVSILRSVLPDVTSTNPAMAPAIRVARALITPSGLDRAWAHQEFLRDHHAGLLAVAWDAIRGRYPND